MTSRDIDISDHTHDHVFGLDRPRSGEARTKLVTVITLVAMTVEIAAGLAYGSMALLADGLHMGSHALALGISAFAYMYARRNAGSEAFTFGTGKIDALAGYTGAILLGLFAAGMAYESTVRLFNPQEIQFGMALLVAVAGLVVNLVCAVILGREGHDHHHHGHGHAHGHHHNHEHTHEHPAKGDYALKSAYLHVLADALTSVLAIAALVVAMYSGLVWIDAVIGLVGAVIIARWAWGLLRDTSGTLVDQAAPGEIRRKVRKAIEAQGRARVADLHVWAIGPDRYAAAVSIVATEPATPDSYREAIPDGLGVVHATIEVHEAP